MVSAFTSLRGLLHDDGLDLVIAAGELSDAAEHPVAPLFSDRFVVAAGDGLAGELGERLTLRQLAELPYLVYRQGGAQSRADLQLDARGIARNPVITVESFVLVPHLLRGTRLAARAPRRARRRPGRVRGSRQMPERHLPTSHDVARRAGVSQPTVSRALRDDPNVSEETRLLVREAADELGYILSQRGRSLSTRLTGQIGVVVRDLANPFYLQVLDTVHDTLARDGLRMLVLTPDEDENAFLARLLDGSLDGAILTTTLLTSTLPAQLARRGFPFVLLNRSVDEPPGDVCVVDNLQGARLAAEELVRLGHREIGALFGPLNTSTGRDREAGFRRALLEHGITLPPERWQRGTFDFGYGFTGTLELLETGPTAIFAANDVVAIGAYNALRSRGITLPDELTLIGFDDIALASWNVFELTTIRQDINALVARSTQMLLERIGAGGSLSPRRVVVQPELVARATHGPPPRR
jgi:LacI family transcriptional regulator